MNALVKYLQEQSLLLRVPYDIHQQFEEWVENDCANPNEPNPETELEIEIELFDDGCGIMSINGGLFRVRLCTLPHHVETFKTFDDHLYYQSGDIHQVLVVEGGEIPSLEYYTKEVRSIAARPEDHNWSPSKQIVDSFQHEKGFGALVINPQLPHGLAPSLRHVVQRAINTTFEPTPEIVSEAELAFARMEPNQTTYVSQYELVSKEEAMRVQKYIEMKQANSLSYLKEHNIPLNAQSMMGMGGGLMKPNADGMMNMNNMMSTSDEMAMGDTDASQPEEQPLDIDSFFSNMFQGINPNNDDHDEEDKDQDEIDLDFSITAQPTIVPKPLPITTTTTTTTTPALSKLPQGNLSSNHPTLINPGGMSSLHQNTTAPPGSSNNINSQPGMSSIHPSLPLLGNIGNISSSHPAGPTTLAGGVSPGTGLNFDEASSSMINLTGIGGLGTLGNLGTSNTTIPALDNNNFMNLDFSTFKPMDLTIPTLDGLEGLEGLNGTLGLGSLGNLDPADSLIKYSADGTMDFSALDDLAAGLGSLANFDIGDFGKTPIDINGFGLTGLDGLEIKSGGLSSLDLTMPGGLTSLNTLGGIGGSSSGTNNTLGSTPGTSLNDGSESTTSLTGGVTGGITNTGSKSTKLGDISEPSALNTLLSMDLGGLDNIDVSLPSTLSSIDMAFPDLKDLGDLSSIGKISGLGELPSINGLPSIGELPPLGDIGKDITLLPTDLDSIDLSIGLGSLPSLPGDTTTTTTTTTASAPPSNLSILQHKDLLSTLSDIDTTVSTLDPAIFNTLTQQPPSQQKETKKEQESSSTTSTTTDTTTITPVEQQLHPPIEPAPIDPERLRLQALVDSARRDSNFADAKVLTAINPIQKKQFLNNANIAKAKLDDAQAALDNYQG